MTSFFETVCIVDHFWVGNNNNLSLSYEATTATVVITVENKDGEWKMAIESEELLATSFVILVILLLLSVLMRFYGLNIALQTPNMQRSSEKPRIYDSVSVKNPFNVEIHRRETLLETGIQMFAW